MLNEWNHLAMDVVWVVVGLGGMVVLHRMLMPHGNEKGFFFSAEGVAIAVLLFPFAKQDIDRIRGSVGHCQIRNSISVEVAHGKLVGTRSRGGTRTSDCERSVSVPQQNRDHTGVGVQHSHVQFAVSIEVGNDEWAEGVGEDRRTGGAGVRPGRITQENHQRLAWSACANDQVRDAIHIEVSYGRSTWTVRRQA